METAYAMYIPNENNEETGKNSMFPRNDEARLNTNSDTSGIRIHINGNGGRDTPYIVLRRKSNSNMRLRINQGMNSNAPLRIVYAGNQHSSSDSNGPLHPQHAPSRQRIVLRSPEVNENPTMFARNQLSTSESTRPFDPQHASSTQRIVFRTSGVNENPTGAFDNQLFSDSTGSFDISHDPSRQRIVFRQSEVNENPTRVFERNQQSISDSTGLFDQSHAPSRPRIVFRQSDVNGNPSRIILKSTNQSRVRISSRNFKQSRSRQ
ncbi:Hypothetical predicted protein [Mytilus galloprovincialis]|uniref:Uncharacterized protein n=1 Tax=Mytilus galloprovincialis TaxID=29158 RepID=A0A8B6D139_MYTGA|nr:Hypothetical predicted protein [Mytilus galloprovincialis]